MLSALAITNEIFKKADALRHHTRVNFGNAGNGCCVVDERVVNEWIRGGTIRFRIGV